MRRQKVLTKSRKFKNTISCAICSIVFLAVFCSGFLYKLDKMSDNVSILLTRYKELNLHDVLDYERFNEYTIVHNSSSIEGSTLTEVETRLLLEEDITPKGKPLTHSLMVKDHYLALRYVIDAALQRRPLLLNLFSRLMRS